MGKKKVIDEIKWNALCILTFIGYCILADIIFPQINIFNDSIFIKQAIFVGIIGIILTAGTWGIVEWIKG